MSLLQTYWALILIGCVVLVLTSVLWAFAERRAELRRQEYERKFRQYKAEVERSARKLL